VLAPLIDHYTLDVSNGVGRMYICFGIQKTSRKSNIHTRIIERSAENGYGVSNQ